MKVKVWSDLHLEFRQNQFDHIHIPHEDDKETTLLLAGDIALGLQSVPFIEEMCKHFKYVLMICGNHEFYHHQIERVVTEFQAWELEGSPKNFHFLYNDWRVLDGVRFLGGTMWTSFNAGDPIVIRAAKVRMNDYESIYGADGLRISPHFILRENDRFMDFLIEKFDEPFDGPTVVMSHHSPGNIIKRKGRMGDMLDHCYFADIETLIGDRNIAKLWVHGHTHRNWDYMINETRVVCNPYGYYGEATNPGFDTAIVLEV